MKPTTSKWFILLTLVISLTACGQRSVEQDKTPVQPIAITETQAPANDTQTPSSEKPTDEPASTEVPITKSYVMNKVYNIVPAQEGIEKKVVLLTFDDGPKDEKMINSLIDTLDKHQAKAIFFVNGYRVKAHPELLKLIHDREQIIGNHSWDHINLKKESEANIKKQIEDVQKIVKDTIGEAPKFFRPPFGIGNDTVRKIVKDNGMLFMTWSNGSLDWDSKNKNKPDAVIKNVLDQLHPGSNILMHELPWTVEALDELLTKLEDKGYSFVNPLAIDFEKDMK
ncbi:polysaccharide deacetylase family protein [Paenibacillus terrigena]|uniref:polysaccharide deacetylase family protein n=1 Tax=Paenibacillus terrigena TaxID=369333 RepID=UPI0028D37AE4|nr:polysaccharide deacetylase family protein [Paenibacillus terrigena]